MGASKKCPDIVSGRMGASRDRAAGELAGYARTHSTRMWRGQRCCPGSRILKSSGSAVAASGSSFSPPFPGTVVAAREQGTVTRRRAHPQLSDALCLPSCTDSCRWSLGEAFAQIVFARSWRQPQAWVTTLGREPQPPKEQKLAGCFWDNGKEIPFLCL